MSLLLLRAVAAAESNYAGGKWALLDPKKVMAAADTITTAKYPDSDAATVEKKMVRVYRADGTGECQDETFVKVLTEKGKRGNRSLRLDYMLPYSTAEAIKIEVLKPGGKSAVVDVAANAKEMIDDSQMGMNIYDPNSKILQVNIPQVEIGDVVHTITRTTIHRSYIPGEYAEENVFEGSDYLRHTTYEIYAPRDKPLKRIFLRDEVPGTVKHTMQNEKDGIHHRWEITNVPRMFDEPAMPPYEMVLQRLLVSTTPNWQAVSKWYWGLSKPHLDATTPELKKTVAELTAGATSDLDKVKALFFHVSKKIRYMGLTPEKDRPGFEPHDVKLTFENKYGVCRDKAALLVSMLRTAGLKSYPVLINVGGKKDAEVPEPFFNHAIVSVELKPGLYTLMDPTAENTKDLLPSYECDLSFLVCRAEGEIIRTSPVIPPEQNMMRVKTTAALNAAGSLSARSELWFEGINDTEYREMFSRMKPDDKQRFFESVLKRAMPGAKLKSLKLWPEDMLDITAGVRAELEFAVEGMTASGDGKAVVNLPWMGKNLGIVSFILGGTGLEKRKYPLRTYIACGLKEEISVQLDGFDTAVSLPSYPAIADETLSYERRVQAKGTTLACSGDFKLKAVEFTPKQYLKLKGTLKALEYDERKAPVMAIPVQGAATEVAKETPAAGPKVESNARILESHKELDITDAHSQLYKVRYAKEVLNYSGKKNEAEVKIGFNPACEEAKLIRAVVISKAGQRQEIATNEINVMDAGWNASAKRYTGGKILVANLPGVDIGSTIEVEYQVATKGKAFLSGFESFQLFDDLEKKDVRITAPCAVPVQTILTGPSGVVTQETNAVSSTQTFRWRAEKVKALPAEPQLPPEWSYMAGVQYFAGDITTYFSELHDLLLDRSRKSAKAAEVARQLTAKTANRLEAATAIRDFIARSIRVAGPSFTELPLSELSTADTTLADGYGHMADRAILFHAMLTAAEFQPEFVLASGLPPIAGITNIASSFPLPQSFQTPLVRIIVEGETYYLNDTDQYSKLGSTSHNGRLAFVLPNRNCEVIRATSGCADKTDTVYTLSLSNSGKTRVGVSRHYYGGHHGGKNKFFTELPPEERKRYFQEVVSEVAQGGKAIGDLTTKFDTYPGMEQYTVEVEHYSVVDGKYCYFDLPFTPSLFSLGADHRTLPLYISWQAENSVRTEIEMPPGFKHIDMAPRSQDLTAPGGGGKTRITSHDDAGKRVLTHDFETSPTIISPQDYPAMLKLEAALGQKSSKVFLLEKQ
jgi:transglutaminase-like putative cysteine protease